MQLFRVTVLLSYVLNRYSRIPGAQPHEYIYMYAETYICFVYFRTKASHIRRIETTPCRRFASKYNFACIRFSQFSFTRTCVFSLYMRARVYVYKSSVDIFAPKQAASVGLRPHRAAVSRQSIIYRHVVSCIIKYNTNTRLCLYYMHVFVYMCTLLLVWFVA